MRYSTLHTHTIFSDGKHMPEDNVLSAIEKNMVSIGFSDHSSTDFKLDCCIKPVTIPAYIAEIRRLQKKYADQIEIYLGMEYDGYSVVKDRELYDYIIGDAHYLKIGDEYCTVDDSRDTQLRHIEQYFNGDHNAYIKMYFETYVDSVQRLKPDILGHFDLLTKFNVFDENSPAYRKAALEALTASLKVSPLIEMNTGAMSRKAKDTPYPAPFLLKEILNQGGHIILNSDSHDLNHLDFYFNESIEILRSVGYDHIIQLIGGKFTEVGI